MGVAALEVPPSYNRPDARSVRAFNPIIMSQTMEQTDNGSLRDQEEPEQKQKSRRPANSAFRQQRLRAWQPILTPKTVLPLFFAVGIIFAPIGGLLLWASTTVQEIQIDYSGCSQSPVVEENSTTGFADIPSDRISKTFQSGDFTGARPAQWGHYVYRTLPRQRHLSWRQN